MSENTNLLDAIREALPDVRVTVSPIPAEGKALVMWNDISGEYVTVTKYEGDRGPRAMVCYQGHGATRFEWDTREKKYKCVKCMTARREARTG